MNTYIKNKIKIKKKVNVLSILFWIVNLIFLQISANLLLKIICFGKSEQFNKAAMLEKLNDPFFIERADFILSSMMVTLFAIICFSSATVILFRNMQLKNAYTQMGVYVVVGYGKIRLFIMYIVEPLLEMLIAFPISLVISMIVWKGLAKWDTINLLLNLIGSNEMLNIVAYVLSIMLMILVVLVHTWAFIRISIKKGIRFLLGKGIV